GSRLAHVYPKSRASASRSCAAAQSISVVKAFAPSDSIRSRSTSGTCRCAPTSSTIQTAPLRSKQSVFAVTAILRRSPGARLTSRAQAPAPPRGFELPLEPRLPRIGSVDAVALEERAGSLAKRSIKREAKVFALELAIRMMDLTTLEGQDTPGK